MKRLIGNRYQKDVLNRGNIPSQAQNQETIKYENRNLFHDRFKPESENRHNVTEKKSSPFRIKLRLSNNIDNSTTVNHKDFRKNNSVKFNENNGLESSRIVMGEIGKPEIKHDGVPQSTNINKLANHKTNSQPILRIKAEHPRHIQPQDHFDQPPQSIPSVKIRLGRTLIEKNENEDDSSSSYNLFSSDSEESDSEKSIPTQSSIQYHPSDPRSKLVPKLAKNDDSRKEGKTNVDTNEIDEVCQPCAYDDVSSSRLVPSSTKEIKRIEESQKGRKTNADTDKHVAVCQPCVDDNVQSQKNEGKNNNLLATSYPDDVPKPTSTVQEKNKSKIIIPPPHILLHHSVPLPQDVRHVINTIYPPDTCPKPKVKKNEDPCGCTVYSSSSNGKCCNDLDCVNFACQEECLDNCEAGHRCQNKRMTRRQWKKVEVFDAHPKGRGLRTMEAIRKGELVTEYVGVATPKKLLDTLFQQYHTEPMLYIMALDNQIYIDARTVGGAARYINHSCDPNCKVDRWKVRGITRAGVFALRDIPTGEELSFDYQWTRRRGRAPTKCHCNSFNCRGTLELPKDKDIYEEEMEIKLRGYWRKPDDQARGELAGDDIVNRVIKVYFEGNHEYFVGDVCKYDKETKKHLVIYKTDMEESWEDLNKCEWMILDEEAEHFVIQRRNKNSIEKKNSVQDENCMNSQHRNEFVHKIPKAKTYIIVQSPVREAILAKHLIDKCQRYCRVQVSSLRCLRNNTSVDEEEAAEEEEALNNSKDGIAWKLTITGLEPLKAIMYLEKNIELIQNNLDHGGNIVEVRVDMLPSKDNIQEQINAEKTHTTENRIKKAPIGSPLHGSASNAGKQNTQEMILPPSAADSVKANLFNIRSKCWNVTINFKHVRNVDGCNTQSSRANTCLHKLHLTAYLPHDLLRAQNVLWEEVHRILQTEHGKGNQSLPHSEKIGFKCGDMSKRQWNMFLGMRNESFSRSEEESDHNLPCGGEEEDNLRKFQLAQNCTLWAQSCDEESSVKHRSSLPSSPPSKYVQLYVGCNPNRLHKIWCDIKSRVQELERGVKFFPLLSFGNDVTFLNILKEKNTKWRDLCSLVGDDNNQRTSASFFEFMQVVYPGTNVCLDTLTENSHIRIDGVNVENSASDSHQGDTLKEHQNGNFSSDISVSPETIVSTLPSTPTTSLAVEIDQQSRLSTDTIANVERIIQAQVSFYTDHCHRQQHWIFGRDWASHQNIASKLPLYKSVQSSQSFASSRATTTLHNMRDPRTISTSCTEIALITQQLLLHNSVAAHAATIFYRIANVCATFSELKSGFKVRDIVSACVFIANKSQKATKWKRLELVLETAYRVFYPDLNLDVNSEEARRLEKRILDAEHFILLSLQYDVFWLGVDWITPVSLPYLSQEISSRAMDIILSAPMLAAGPLLWLSAGPKYAFSTVAGFLQNDCLPSFFSVFDLDSQIMLEVVDLVSTTVESFCEASTSGSGRTIMMYSSLKKKIMNSLHLVKAICQVSHPTVLNRDNTWVNIISKSDIAKYLDRVASSFFSRRVLRGVDSNLINHYIIPNSASIYKESKCRPTIEETFENGSKVENVILDGSWRSVAMAEMAINRASSRHGTNDNIFNQERYKERVKFTSCNSTIPTLVRPSPVSPPPVSSTCLANSSIFSSAVLLPIHYASDLERTRKWKGRILPGLVSSDGATFRLKERSRSFSFRAFEGNHCLDGSLSTQQMANAGLSWWIPPYLGTSQRGAICDVLALWERSGKATSLNEESITQILQMILCGANDDILVSGFEKHKPKKELLVDVSFQRWPARKVETRERTKKKSATSANGTGMDMGFSAAALQEMQLLSQIHNQIRAPQGHPNFTLPIGICVSDEKEKRAICIENNIADRFLVLERTPFSLQKILTRSKKRNSSGMKEVFITPALFSSWMYDLLSALTYSHMNSIVLRTLHPDQLLINSVGELKVSNLARTIVIPHDERDKTIDPLRNSRFGSDVNDELFNNPYMSPEMLLGSTRYTKETDIWSIGCLLAHLLLNKSLFSGEDRFSHTKSIFKVVGTPSNDNYQDAERFPHYGRSKPAKVYKKGVRKALLFHLKNRKETKVESYNGAMDLLEQMLDLDPKKRITSAGALEHPYMLHFLRNRDSDFFQREFVSDWLTLKEKLLEGEEYGKVSKVRMDDYAKYLRMSQKKTGDKRKKGELIEELNVDNDDDLYNLDAELNVTKEEKRPKIT